MQQLEGGDLPNGGAYALVYYRDSDGSAVPKAEALRAEVVEFDATGIPIAITFIDLSSPIVEPETGPAEEP